MPRKLGRHFQQSRDSVVDAEPSRLGHLRKKARWKSSPAGEKVSRKETHREELATCFTCWSFWGQVTSGEHSSTRVTVPMQGACRSLLLIWPAMEPKKP